MSRSNASAQRSLSLTEELERLEQSITLTLQGEIYPAQHSPPPQSRSLGSNRIDSYGVMTTFNLHGYRN